MIRPQDENVRLSAFLFGSASLAHFCLVPDKFISPALLLLFNAFIVFKLLLLEQASVVLCRMI